MQMYDVFVTRESYEDRINQLKKDYDSSERKVIREQFERVMKIVKRKNR